jgi:hypothetical protein
VQSRESSGDPAAANELENNHDYCDYEQGVDQTSCGERGCQAKGPKNQKYHGNSVEHDLFSLDGPVDCDFRGF